MLLLGCGEAISWDESNWVFWHNLSTIADRFWCRFLSKCPQRAGVIWIHLPFCTWEFYIQYTNVLMRHGCCNCCWCQCWCCCTDNIHLARPIRPGCWKLLAGKLWIDGWNPEISSIRSLQCCSSMRPNNKICHQFVPCSWASLDYG